MALNVKPKIPLPLDEAEGEILKALRSHRSLVLVAEPGAGKSTRFPTLLSRSGLVPEGKKILMLEPRRLAARAAAKRIADEEGWPIGREVGYQVRFDNKTTRETRIEILTEGLLARRLLDDPELSNVGAVILDEFHERSQHTDIALGLLFELQALARPDLRLIVMSATLDADRVASYLESAPIVRVPGRTFPVQVSHAKRPLMLDTGPSFSETVAETVLEVLSGKKQRIGDILVFLPGAREIRFVRERVSAAAETHGAICVELHGSLSLEDQDRAIRKADQTKIILATNIAETSLTIDGVGTVIDTGLARVVRLDSAGFERLTISRISLASATQRSGRAGRQGPGLSYRLWSKHDEASMPLFEQPELLRTDLTDALLGLLGQGVLDPRGFSWFEKPPQEALDLALKTLADLGFREEPSGHLTPEGQEALRLPVPVRPAKLLIEAAKIGAESLATSLAALLSEKDFVSRAHDLKKQAHLESDLLLRWHLWMNGGTHGVAARSLEQVRSSLRDQIRRIDLKKLKHSPLIGESKTLSEDDLALRLLLLAYSDRLCKRRRPKELACRMVGGRGVNLAAFSAVETAPLFVALATSEPPGQTAASSRLDAVISMASYVDLKWIESYFPASIGKRSTVAFDAETLSVQKLMALSFRDLPLEDAHVSRPSPDEAFPVLIKAAKEKWDTLFRSHESLGRLLNRLDWAREAPLTSSKFADFDLESSRTSFLEEICFGETKLAPILSKNLPEAFSRHLPEEISHFLESELPDSLEVPSGSRIRIEYPEGREPYLEVRVQEIFGWTVSPRIANGKVPVVLHLLGPNYRPVQVTSDLESFWRVGYIEVRKELRTRYPKHSWPEDPFTAKPEAKGRRRT